MLWCLFCFTAALAYVVFVTPLLQSPQSLATVKLKQPGQTPASDANVISVTGMVVHWRGTTSETNCHFLFIQKHNPGLNEFENADLPSSCNV